MEAWIIRRALSVDTSTKSWTSLGKKRCLVLIIYRNIQQETTINIPFFWFYLRTKLHLVIGVLFDRCYLAFIMVYLLHDTLSENKYTWFFSLRLVTFEYVKKPFWKFLDPPLDLDWHQNLLGYQIGDLFHFTTDASHLNFNACFPVCVAYFVWTQRKIKYFWTLNLNLTLYVFCRGCPSTSMLAFGN